MSDRSLAITKTVAPHELEWRMEIREAHEAIERLLAAKKRTLRRDPTLEHVLWSRHCGELSAMKRKMDAVAL